MLVNGKWTEDWQPVQATDAKGGFVRQVSSFRNWVTPDGSAGPTGEDGFAAERGRYHLYVALICPWASRTLIARKLKKLDDVITVSVVEPALSDQGWRFGDFPGSNRDDLNGATYLHEIYSRKFRCHQMRDRRNHLVFKHAHRQRRFEQARGPQGVADQALDRGHRRSLRAIAWKAFANRCRFHGVVVGRPGPVREKHIDRARRQAGRRQRLLDRPHQSAGRRIGRRHVRCVVRNAETGNRR